MPEIKVNDIVGLVSDKYGNGWHLFPLIVLAIDEPSQSAKVAPAVFAGLDGVPFPEKVMLGDLETWRYWDKNQNIPLIPFG